MRRFTRRLRLLLGSLCFIAALALAVAACGGAHHHSRRSLAPIAVTGPTGVTEVSGRPCDPRNQVMQCVLPPAPPGLPGAPASVLHGIDFAWSCPAPGGHSVGESYLSDSSKDWTVSCLHLWHAAGKATVFVWETAGTRALDGCAAGASDARAAAAELARDGAPAGQPFDMAIDFDASGPEVASYFSCALHAEPGRVNAYGGYRPLLYLSQHGDVGHLNWQTYAWSGGAFLPASIAPLEQYLNGSAVDYDRAIAANYGQWPYVPPKPPGPSPSQIKAWTQARNAALHSYRAHKCGYPVLVGPAVCHEQAAAVISWQQKLPGRRPVCWGPHAQLSAPVCQIVRPTVSIYNHAAASTWNAYQRDGCHGPAQPIAKGTPLCRKLQQRGDYFDAKARALFKAWA